jgi:CHASE2 domain-containing sensor protein
MVTKKIVLVSIGNANRVQITESISMLSECSPKVIAINLIFPQRKSQREDSLLATSISSAKNVVLAQNIQNNNLITSNSIFTDKCLGQGVVEFVMQEGKAVEYSPFITHGDSLLWSFPVAIAIYFDLDAGEQILKNKISQERSIINFYPDHKKILLLENLDFLDCAEVKDNIVLIGYLGPTDEDVFFIEGQTDGKLPQKMYGTEILANILIDLLSESRPR